jgi:hypothetical protein
VESGERRAAYLVMYAGEVQKVSQGQGWWGSGAELLSTLMLSIDGLGDLRTSWERLVIVGVSKNW